MVEPPRRLRQDEASPAPVAEDGERFRRKLRRGGSFCADGYTRCTGRLSGQSSGSTGTSRPRETASCAMLSGIHAMPPGSLLTYTPRSFITTGDW